MIALYDYENSLRKKIQYERQDAMKAGEENKSRKIAQKLFARGDNVDDIAGILNYPFSTVREWLGLPF